MEEKLLRRAQAGDPEATESVLSQLESMVWRVCWHYTGDRENASDCGQEAMVRIWRSLASFRFDCAFETWAYRIAANCCLDFQRRMSRRPSVSLEPMREEGFDPPDPAPGTEEKVIRDDEHARLRNAIAGLPEEMRDALVLTQLEGRSYEEAARLLSTQEGTIKSRVNRARARLKEWMRDGEPFAGESVQRMEAPEEAGTVSRRRRRRDAR